MVQLRLVNGCLLFQRLLLPPRQRHGSAGRQARNRELTRTRGRAERQNAQHVLRVVEQLGGTVRKKFNLIAFDFGEEKFFWELPQLLN